MSVDQQKHDKVLTIEETGVILNFDLVDDLVKLLHTLA